MDMTKHISGTCVPMTDAWCEECGIIIKRVKPNGDALLISTPLKGILCPDCRIRYGMACYVSARPKKIEYDIT